MGTSTGPLMTSACLLPPHPSAAATAAVPAGAAATAPRGGVSDATSAALRLVTVSSMWEDSTSLDRAPCVCKITRSNASCGVGGGRRHCCVHRDWQEGAGWRGGGLGTPWPPAASPAKPPAGTGGAAARRHPAAASMAGSWGGGGGGLPQLKHQALCIFAPSTPGLDVPAPPPPRGRSPPSWPAAAAAPRGLQAGGGGAAERRRRQLRSGGAAGECRAIHFRVVMSCISTIPPKPSSAAQVDSNAQHVGRHSQLASWVTWDWSVADC